MQERFLNLQYNKREMKIRYLESDNGNVEKQQRLLFIHGLGSSADRWLDIPDALSLYFHTIAIDLPGFGGSDKPSNMEYTIEAFSNIVAEFMNNIRIIEENRGNNYTRTTLVGHSLGGYIASKIAASAENSNFVDKL